MCAGRRARRVADAAVRAHRLVAAAMLCIAVLAHARGVPLRCGAPLCSARSSAPAGWLAGVWWLFISLHRYGDLPAWLAALAVLALALALSLYLALAMAAVGSARAARLLARRVVLAAAWLLAELARTSVHRLSVARVGLRAGRFARWRCSRRGSACSASVRCWLAFAALGSQAAVASRRRRPLSVGALALAVPWHWAGVVQPTGATLSVSLLQRNVPQDEKFVTEQLPNTLRALTADRHVARGQLVVAPETAIPLLPSQLDELAPGYWRRCSSASARPAAAADHRRAARRLRSRLQQLGGRPDGRAAPGTVPLRQAAPGAVRRIHADRAFAGSPTC